MTTSSSATPPPYTWRTQLRQAVLGTAIGGGLFFGIGWLLITMLACGCQANSFTADINTVQAGIDHRYASGDFSELSNAQAIVHRLVPSNWKDENHPSRLTHLHGGEVYLRPHHVGDEEQARYFTITAHDIPKDACLKYVPALVGSMDAVTTSRGVADDTTGLLGRPVTFDPTRTVGLCDDATTTLTMYGSGRDSDYGPPALSSPPSLSPDKIQAPSEP